MKEEVETANEVTVLVTNKKSPQIVWVGRSFEAVLGLGFLNF